MYTFGSRHKHSAFENSYPRKFHRTAIVIRDRARFCRFIGYARLLLELEERVIGDTDSLVVPLANFRK